MLHLLGSFSVKRLFEAKAGAQCPLYEMSAVVSRQQSCLFLFSVNVFLLHPLLPARNFPNLETFSA